ncbi:23S rRNA (adenine(1618)-N(6))-methyltransferase RlmF [Aliiglaciecola sp. LCG003]|uniref:23S rRNA (adenine(1618)-N(6))-methyltransferase RlmF n=1 Tax=Aliiglaciecola sp. LCG003 TaxID=3053655 RepID=UPI0025746703|nr:23S rRNA (adenine(1618)-N(6))-methyltransferase RlmF [Aliiglaciecola sp. LCG003]WJG09354.1 23S rRNA (adenine(1618)-N(6))-methyltransferase RlmF [Aliiglaciecola sp. LCG003]
MSTLHHRNKSQTKPNRGSLHPRNLHNQGYDFPSLIKSYPPLSGFVKTNAHGNLSVEFSDPLAVKALNTALLKRHYKIDNWNIPQGALCPPIPGRADYIHYIAELLGVDEPSAQHTNTPSKITLLDIGTGANGIYPLLACQIYGWHCVGSDINPQSLDNVASIIAKNPTLKDCFSLRIQQDKNLIFAGIIQAGECFDVSVCNPPFHASQQEALKGSQLKLNNLARNRGEQTPKGVKNDTSSQSVSATPTLNFGGLEAELWCKGGEQMFLKKMIKESQVFSAQCRWFTSLVSKIDNVKPAMKLMRKLGASDIRQIDMKQGNKITRILAWTFI